MKEEIKKKIEEAIQYPLGKYVNDEHTQEECKGFIDGFEQGYSLAQQKDCIVKMEDKIEIILPSATSACKLQLIVKSMVGEVLFNHTFYGDSKPLAQQSVNSNQEPNGVKEIILDEIEKSSINKDGSLKSLPLLYWEKAAERASTRIAQKQNVNSELLEALKHTNSLIYTDEYPDVYKNNIKLIERISASQNQQSEKESDDVEERIKNTAIEYGRFVSEEGFKYSNERVYNMFLGSKTNQ